jgi:hypothetical protein
MNINQSSFWQGSRRQGYLGRVPTAVPIWLLMRFLEIVEFDRRGLDDASAQAA